MRKKCINYQNLEARLVWRYISASKMIQCELNGLGKDLRDDEKLGGKEMYPRTTVQVQRQISSPYHRLPIPAVADKRLLCFPSVNSILHGYSTAQGMKLQRNTMTAITPEPGMPPFKGPFLSLASGIRWRLRVLTQPLRHVTDGPVKLPRVPVAE